MITGNINHLDAPGAYPPAVLTGLYYLQQYDFSLMAPGRYEVDGDNIFLIVCDLTTEPAEDRKLEAHREYIDIHLLLRGTENIGFNTLHDGMEILVPYDEETDMIFFKNCPGESIYRLLPGYFSVCFPGDVHRTLCCSNKPAPVHKVLMKVACSMLIDEFLSNRVINWGMIGTGDVTEKKSGPGLYKTHGSNLLGLYNRTYSKAADYARRHNVKHVFNSAEKLISHSDIDAIYLATPPDSHVDYALTTIAAGKPVYIEKPLAPTVEECRKIAAAAEQAGVPVFTAFYRRALPRFHKVKEILDKNILGKIQKVTITYIQPLPLNSELHKSPNPLPWRLDSNVSPGGMFLDTTIHTIDILDFLLGPITVRSRSAESLSGISETFDTVKACWEHPQDIVGYGEWFFCAPEDKDSVDRMTIKGEYGEVTLSVYDNSPVLLEVADKTETYAFPDLKHIQQPYIQGIVNELLGQGVHHGSLESSIHAVEVFEQMLGLQALGN